MYFLYKRCSKNNKSEAEIKESKRRFQFVMQLPNENSVINFNLLKRTKETVYMMNPIPVYLESNTGLNAMVGTHTMSI